MDAAGLTEIDVFESVFPCSLVRILACAPCCSAFAFGLESCRVLLSSLKARLAPRLLLTTLVLVARRQRPPTPTPHRSTG